MGYEHEHILKRELRGGNGCTGWCEKQEGDQDVELRSIINMRIREEERYIELSITGRRPSSSSTRSCRMSETPRAKFKIESSLR
ncbi:hypothetical protein KM043_008053 [Ampulex compressa]|nr:hypothetical protein KM043_008053 [Ampulex compressa]